jgi:segregation and condensation protein A
MEKEDSVSPYSVRAGAFEGPLDLLLSLIENKKFFINEISLAEVTNDYISYIKSLNQTSNEKQIGEVSYFVLIASTLILIKSKSLLPNLSITEEEKEDISALEKRLRIYQIFKKAGVEINRLFGKNIIFMPLERIWSTPIFSPDPLITPQNLLVSVKNAISNAPKKEVSLPKIEVKKIINIEEVIDNISERVKNAVKLSFKDLTKGDGSRPTDEAKTQVIISFLAMLELVREGIIEVIQNSSFGDIEINKNKDEFEQKLVAN